MTRFTRSLTVAVPAALLLLSQGTAWASENGQSAYPAGAESPYIANFPPIPGIFALEQTSYATADELYGNDGKELPVPFHSAAFAQTTRLLINYPFHPLGAQLTTQLVFPYVHVETNVGGMYSEGSGLAGITITPVIASWRFFHTFNVSVGLDLMPNSGDYDPRSASPGIGYSSYSPVLALRYQPWLTSGPVLALSQRLLLNSTNHTTHYDSGDSYIDEFQAGWKFNHLQVSAVGAYQTQYQNDDVNGHEVAPDGDRLEQLRYGPSVTYTTDAFGPPIQFNLNYQKGMQAQNTGKSSYLWFNVALPLYVPSMMHHT